jgi:hypothetical protein
MAAHSSSFSSSGGGGGAASGGSSGDDDPVLMARLLKLPYMLRERVAVSVPRIAPVGPFNFGDALRLNPEAAGRVAVAGRAVRRLRIAVDASGGCFSCTLRL